MELRTVGVLLALLASCSWGASAIFVKLGLQHMATSAATLISLAVGSLFVLIIATYVHGQAVLALPAAAFGWFALLGLLNFLFGRLLNFTAIDLAGVARTAPVTAIAPLFAAAWAVTLAGERPAALTLVGGAAIILGVVTILTERRGQ